MAESEVATDIADAREVDRLAANYATLRALAGELAEAVQAEDVRLAKASREGIPHELWVLAQRVKECVERGEVGQ